MDTGQLIRMDVARWLDPGSLTDPDEVDLKQALILVYRNVGLRAVVALRIGSWFAERGIPLAPSFVQRLIFRRYGLEIAVGAPIGGGLYIAHPAGTTIAPHEIGENCSVIAAVTVGMRNTHAFPRIGDRVFLGAGARVLGDIELGDDARVGANAVVIADVPADTSVAGIPAAPLS